MDSRQAPGSWQAPKRYRLEPWPKAIVVFDAAAMAP